MREDFLHGDKSFLSPEDQEIEQAASEEAETAPAIGAAGARTGRILFDRTARLESDLVGLRNY